MVSYWYQPHGHSKPVILNYITFNTYNSQHVHRLCYLDCSQRTVLFVSPIFQSICPSCSTIFANALLEPISIWGKKLHFKLITKTCPLIAIVEYSCLYQIGALCRTNRDHLSILYEIIIFSTNLKLDALTWRLLTHLLIIC